MYLITFKILTCSWQENDCIQLWDYGSCKLIETIKPDNQQSKLYCGKLVPETNLILCGGSDSNILRLIDVNMKIVRTFFIIFIHIRERNFV